MHAPKFVSVYPTQHPYSLPGPAQYHTLRSKYSHLSKCSCKSYKNNNFEVNDISMTDIIFAWLLLYQERLSNGKGVIYTVTTCSRYAKLTLKHDLKAQNLY